MNTANLQLQGVLTVLASLLQAIEKSGTLSRAEIEVALDRAQSEAAASARQHDGLSDAHVDAACFPARYLRMAMSGGGGTEFSEVATAVGQNKDNTQRKASSR